MDNVTYKKEVEKVNMDYDELIQLAECINDPLWADQLRDRQKELTIDLAEKHLLYIAGS